jgi:hypothetical protein
METVWAANRQPDWTISSAKVAILAARDKLFSARDTPSNPHESIAQFTPT